MGAYILAGDGLSESVTNMRPKIDHAQIKLTVYAEVRVCSI